MKTNLLALATLLLISIAGCEQKPTLVDKPTEAPLEKQAIQEPAVKNEQRSRS